MASDPAHGNGVSNLALPGSSPLRRAWASAFGVLLLVIAALPAIVDLHDAPVLRYGHAISAAWWIFADFATAFLLIGSFYASGVLTYALVAGVYTICALLAVPYLISLPGFVLAPDAAASSQLAPLFWAARSIAFGVLVTTVIFIDPSARMRVADQRRAARTIALVLAASVVLALAMTLATLSIARSLPSLAHGARYTSGFTQILAPSVACALALSTVLVIGGLRRPSTLQLWLALAMGANALCAALRATAPAQFTGVWYASSLEAFVNAGALLAVLMIDVAGSYRRLAQFARYDPLTGLCNRRAFDDHLAWAIDDAERTGASVGLLVIDIDLFKGFNDRYGHAAGDDAMCKVASSLVATLSPELVARIGGEEFVAVLTQASAQTAYRAGERARVAIERLGIANDGASTRRLTVSIGAAGGSARDLDRIGLFKAADSALYTAKKSGRNRTVLAKNVATRRFSIVRDKKVGSPSESERSERLRALE
jgi:diguanylate cyclase (GGDEF)-like protein